MKWTTDVPTAEGYYWLRLGWEDEPIVVQISGEERKIVLEPGLERDYAVEAVPRALWSGPLTPPESV